MPLHPKTLVLGPLTIPLDEVLADVTIRHGRGGYFDTADAATIQLTVLGVAHALARDLALGEPVIFTCTDSDTSSDVVRFHGRLTDASLDVDELTVIGVGLLSTLGDYTIGAAAYPEETWSARVTRAFTDAGLAALLSLEPPPAAQLNPTLIARPAAPVTLAEYLGELAGELPSIIADTPDGHILVQAVTARGAGAISALDPAEVTYAPKWEKWLPELNVLTVSYGDPSAPSYVNVQDDGSIAQYGPRPQAITTTIKSSTDANGLANLIIGRSAWAQWAIPEAPLLVGRPFRLGQRLTLSGMPDASPHDPWSPILEGWTDTIVSDGQRLHWTMDLAMSDPLLSGLTLAWQDVPVTAAYQWNTIDQAVPWHDATSLDALAP